MTPCTVDVVNYQFKPDLCIKTKKLSKILTPTDLASYQKKKQRSSKPKTDTPKKSAGVKPISDKQLKDHKSGGKLPKKRSVEPGKSAEIVDTDSDSDAESPTKSAKKSSTPASDASKVAQTKPEKIVVNSSEPPKKDKKKFKNTPEAEKEKVSGKVELSSKEKKKLEKSKTNKKSESTRENDNDRNRSDKKSSKKSSKTKGENPDPSLLPDNSAVLKSETKVSQSVKYIGKNVKLLETATIDTIRKRSKSGASNHSDEVAITPVVKVRPASKQNMGTGANKAADRSKGITKSDNTKTASPNKESVVSGAVVMTSLDKDSSCNSDKVKSSNSSKETPRGLNNMDNPDGDNQSTSIFSESRKRKLSDSADDEKFIMNIGKIMSDALQKSAERTSLAEELKKVREIDKEISKSSGATSLPDNSGSKISQAKTSKVKAEGKPEQTSDAIMVTADSWKSSEDKSSMDSLSTEQSCKMATGERKSSSLERVSVSEAPPEKLSTPSTPGTDSNTQIVSKLDTSESSPPDASKSVGVDNSDSERLSDKKSSALIGQDGTKLSAGREISSLDKNRVREVPPETLGASPDPEADTASKQKSSDSLAVDVCESTNTPDTEKSQAIITTAQSSIKQDTQNTDSSIQDKSHHDNSVSSAIGDSITRKTEPARLAEAAQSVINSSKSKDISTVKQKSKSGKYADSTKNSTKSEDKSSEPSNTQNIPPLVKVKDEPISAKTSPTLSSTMNPQPRSTQSSVSESSTSDVITNDKIAVTLLELLRSCGDCKVRLIDCIKHPNVNTKLRDSEYSKMSEEEQREYKRRERRRKEKLERRKQESAIEVKVEVSSASKTEKQEKKRVISDDEDLANEETNPQAPSPSPQGLPSYTQAPPSSSQAPPSSDQVSFLIELADYLVLLLNHIDHVVLMIFFYKFSC